MTPTETQNREDAELLAEVAALLEGTTKVPARAKTTCSQCGGSGSVLVDPADRRKGETTCGRCDGNGEL